MLAAYGFRIPAGALATSADEAVEAAEHIGYPVVMKVVSPDIVHKSDIGGVRVGITTRREVTDAFDLMSLRMREQAPEAHIEGFYVERMVPRGLEVILGMTRDPQFGPMLMFGLGGIFVEVMKDVAFHLAPITADEALQMLSATRSWALLRGARGQRAVDVAAIAAGLQRVSQLATDFPEIAEMDINPLMVGEVGTEPIAADARIMLRAPAAAGRGRLAMQQPFPLDPDWQERYRAMIATPGEAVGRLRAGQRVFVGTGCGTPTVLVEALVKRAHELADVEIIHLLTMGDAPYADRKLTECFLVNSFFIGANIRSHIQEGLGDYTPIMLIDIPHLFNSGQIPLDAVLLQCTPPDVHGKVSLGVSVDVVKSAAENGSLVIAQVNPRMPRTMGDSFLDVADLDLLVPAERALLEIPPPESTAATRLIGEHIAGLVEDGSTVEFGIGRIPHAVVEFLKKKKDLGIHTEMLTDSIIDLIESGAVTGSRKRLDRGLIVASFCMGSQRLYDYVRDNPRFSFRPTEYVNDPGVIISSTRWSRSTPRSRST